MDIRVDRVGDWAGVANMVAHLTEEMNKAKELSLKRWGLKAENVS